MSDLTANEVAEWIDKNPPPDKNSTPEYRELYRDTVRVYRQLTESREGMSHPAPARDPEGRGAKIGKAGFPNAVREVMYGGKDERVPPPFASRNAGSFALGANNAWQGLKGVLGKGDPMAKVAADTSANVGSTGAGLSAAGVAAPAILGSGVITPALIGAGITGLTTNDSAGERVKAAAFDGTLGTLFGLGAKGVSGIGNELGRMGSLDRSRRTLQQVVGDGNRGAISQALGQEARRLAANPGTERLAPQVLADFNLPAIAGLDTIVGNASPGGAATRDLILRNQASKRLGALDAVTPDLKQAIAARKAASAPHYAASDASTITLNPQTMTALEHMPLGAMGKAQENAKLLYQPFLTGDYIPAHVIPSPSGPFFAGTHVPAQYPTMPGTAVHNLKRGISDAARPSDTPLGQISANEIAAGSFLKNRFLPAFENLLPEYKLGREKWIANSPPVDQAKVLGGARRELVGTNPDTGERVRKFLSSIDDGEATLINKAVGRGVRQPGDLSKFLTPQQTGVVDDISSQLLRDISVANQGRGGATAAANVLHDTTRTFHIPTFFSPKVTLTNALLHEQSLRIQKKMQIMLETAMNNPSEFNRILNTLPIEERSLILRTLSKGADSGLPAVAAGPLTEMATRVPEPTYQGDSRSPLGAVGDYLHIGPQDAEQPVQ